MRRFEQKETKGTKEMARVDRLTATVCSQKVRE